MVRQAPNATGQNQFYPFGEHAGGFKPVISQAGRFARMTWLNAWSL
jgi:hypothetical protein